MPVGSVDDNLAEPRDICTTVISVLLRAYPTNSTIYDALWFWLAPIVMAAGEFGCSKASTTINFENLWSFI